MTTVAPADARRMHTSLEPYHGMIYFVDEALQHYSEINLEPGRMGYFASRSAAMGAVSAEMVIATFFNFNPELVRAAIPNAWERATPGQVGAARLRAVDDALHRMVGEHIGSDDMADAAALARRVADRCWPQGRPLYAAHSTLEYPDEPHLALWHALTLLREFRGDGHVAVLVDQQVGPCEALVVHGAFTGGVLSRAVLQGTRGWPDDEWEAAEERLRRRGWLDADGALTDAGRVARQHAEDRTDVLAADPWATLDHDERDRLRPHRRRLQPGDRGCRDVQPTARIGAGGNVGGEVVAARFGAAPLGVLDWPT